MRMINNIHIQNTIKVTATVLPTMPKREKKLFNLSTHLKTSWEIM